MTELLEIFIWIRNLRHFLNEDKIESLLFKLLFINYDDKIESIILITKAINQ